MIFAHPGGEASEHASPLGACERKRSPFVYRAEPQAAFALPNADPTVWPSPSQEAAARDREGNRERLASEVEVIWLDPTAQGLPWLREGFWHRRPKGGAVKAYTADNRGRVVRAFLARRDDLTAYAELQRKRCGTCPIEAMDPRTIRPAVPALPAHPGLLALQREAGR